MSRAGEARASLEMDGAGRARLDDRVMGGEHPPWWGRAWGNPIPAAAPSIGACAAHRMPRAPPTRTAGEPRRRADGCAGQAATVTEA